MPVSKPSRLPTFRKWGKKAVEKTQRTARALKRNAAAIGLAAALSVPAGVAGVKAGVDHYHAIADSFRITSRKVKISPTKSSNDDYSFRTDAFQNPVYEHLVRVSTPSEATRLKSMLKKAYEVHDARLAKDPSYPIVPRSGKMVKGVFYANPPKFSTDYAAEFFRSALSPSDRIFFKKMTLKYEMTPRSRHFSELYVKAMQNMTRNEHIRQATVLGKSAATAMEKKALVFALLYSAVWGGLLLRKRRFLLKKTTAKKRPWNLTKIKERLIELHEERDSREGVGKKLSWLKQRELNGLERIINFESLGELPEEEKEKMRWSRSWKKK